MCYSDHRTDPLKEDAHEAYKTQSSVAFMHHQTYVHPEGRWGLWEGGRAYAAMSPAVA